MKTTIRLTSNTPVERKHGMREGRTFEVEDSDWCPGGVWVDGDAGERVKILNREFEILEGEN